MHKLAQRIVQLHLAASQIDLYHGTNFKFLPGIAKKGLIAESGAIWGGGTALRRGEKAVYLTSNFELAARYALGMDRSWSPMVLEVRISTPKRFKKLKYDPMDRHDDAWDVQDSYDEAWENTEASIARGVSNIVKTMTGEKPYFVHLDLATELVGLDGMNVLQIALQYLRKKHGLGADKRERSKILQLAQKEFVGQEWEYLEVRGDGTLKLTEAYFYTREQLMYMKGLPPSTIKGVWVRTQDFDLSKSSILDTKGAGIQDLPAESATRVEAVISLIGKLRYSGPQDLGDLEDWAEQARDLGYSDLSDYITEIASLDEEELSEVDDWDDTLESFEMGVQEDWGEDRIQNHADWAKVSLKDALKLKPFQ